MNEKLKEDCCTIKESTDDISLCCKMNMIKNGYRYEKFDPFYNGHIYTIRQPYTNEIKKDMKMLDVLNDMLVNNKSELQLSLTSNNDFNMTIYKFTKYNISSLFNIFSENAIFMEFGDVVTFVITFNE